MRFLSFKKKYWFKITKGEWIDVNPVERIQQGLKQTTLRKQKKHLGLHQIRQGSYFKPKLLREPWNYRLSNLEAYH